MMPVIQFENVTKTFPPAPPVLAGVNFRLETGQLLTLEGPSGGGKTTLLRLLAGLEPVGSGRILLDGRDTTDLPPHDRNVAFVFQSPVLYPQLSVRENLAIGVRLRYNHRKPWWKRALPSDDFRQRLSEVADLLELSLLLDRQPATLSGGERQRTVLGRALLRRPAVFLLDEPLAYLDPDLAQRLRDRLKHWFRRHTATVVWVTHLPSEAVAVGDRCAVLRQGQLVERQRENSDPSPLAGAS